MYVYAFCIYVQTCMSRLFLEESTMEDTVKTSKNNMKMKIKKRALKGGEEERDEAEEVDGGAGAGERCEEEAWETLSKGFREAQSVLDQNRVLIRQVDDNHRSRLPGNLAMNVSLIREINGNISKVVEIYSGMSLDFSGIVRQQRTNVAAAEKNKDEDNAEN